MKGSLKLNLTAVLIEDTTVGGYTAYISELPEVVSEGESEEEVVQNLKEALTSIIEFRREEASVDLDARYKTTPLNFEMA